MKNRIAILITCLLAVFMFMAGSSQAAPFYGQIWTITGYNQTIYDLTTTPAGSALASFTVDAIDFDSQALIGSYGGSVTYTQFLSNSLIGAPGPNVLAWADLGSATFGAQPLITDSTTTSFFQFTGTAYFPDTFTIRHDDGFFLYINGVPFDSSYPTAPELATITLANLGLSAGIYNFTLNYAAWNSFPEVLQAPDVSPVPEPITMLLVGFGMLGVAGMRRKLRS